jgi:hypothetical protein
MRAADATSILSHFFLAFVQTCSSSWTASRENMLIEQRRACGHIAVYHICDVKDIFENFEAPFLTANLHASDVNFGGRRAEIKI